MPVRNSTRRTRTSKTQGSVKKQEARADKKQERRADKKRATPARSAARVARGKRMFRAAEQRAAQKRAKRAAKIAEGSVAGAVRKRMQAATQRA